MADPIVDTVVAFVTAVLENPVAGPLVVGALRNFTGYIQKKLFDTTGQTYDKKILGATMTKYLVAVNALNVFVPTEYAYALSVLVDIGLSAAKKLRNGTTTT